LYCAIFIVYCVVAEQAVLAKFAGLSDSAVLAECDAVLAQCDEPKEHAVLVDYAVLAELLCKH
jgi:hypothetical protein